MTCSFHHLGHATRSLEKSRDLLLDWGYEACADPVRDEGIGVVVQFFEASEAPCIELVAPLGPNSPVLRILRQRAGLYHSAWVVDNLASALDLPMMRRAVALTQPMPAQAFDSRCVQFFTTRDGSIVELISQNSG